MAILKMVVTYDVTTTANTTTIFSATGAFSSAVLSDGTSVDISSPEFYFPSTGLNDIIYTLSSSILPTELFRGCQRIYSIAIPKGVTAIRSYCFAYCTSLRYISIPASVTEIGSRIFAADSSLDYVVVQREEPATIDYTSFLVAPSGGTLYYPSGSDYSSWLSTEQYYLGYYGWSGSTFTPPASSGLSLAFTSQTVNNSSGEIDVPVITSGILLSSMTYTTGAGISTTASISGTGNIRISYPANTGGSRTGIITFTLIDRNGNSYVTTFTLHQNGGLITSGTPGEWTAATDTGYTWYEDEGLLAILPTARTLSYDEETAYYPVTADTRFDYAGIEVRASGDVSFTYAVMPSSNENAIELYCYTDDNSGTLVQESKIKVVAFSGTSAYSATTTLLKTPYSLGSIVVSSDPVVQSYASGTTTITLTLNNCTRSVEDELDMNSQLYGLDWLEINLNNETAVTITFTTNSGSTRRTYYNFCGRDSGDRLVYKRLGIEQNGMYISLTPSKTSLDKNSGSLTIAVRSSIGGNFTFSSSDWLTPSSYVSDSSSSGTLTVEYGENTTLSARSGYITVTEQISVSPFTLSASVMVSQAEYIIDGYILSEPETYDVCSSSGYVEYQITYGNLVATPTPLEGEGEIDIEDYDFDGSVFSVTYGENDLSGTKTKTFTLTGETLCGYTVSTDITLSQAGKNVPLAPVWKDYEVSVLAPEAGYVNYTISYDGEVIYTGRAYAFAGADTITFYLNQIIKNYLSNSIDFTEGFQTVPEWLGRFIVSSEEYGNLANAAIFEDYSYENRVYSNEMTLNNPITSEVVEGAFVPFSFFVSDNSSGNVDITYSASTGSGTYSSMTIDDNEQHRFFIEAEPDHIYSALGVSYKTIPSCQARYSLYYVNSYGGVDVLPFRVKDQTKTDNITRNNYSRTFRNDSIEFENSNYLNEIKGTWNLQTGWLNDAQSRKMKELVESTLIYMYDAEEQVYTPVVITDKSLTYKTYLNQGRKIYNYSINLSESQTKIRQ